MLFHRREQQDKTPLRRQLIDGAIELRLKFAGRREVFGRVRRALASPLRLTLLAPIGRTRAIERQAKRDAHEPGAKAASIAQTRKAAVGAKDGFLGDVFGVGAVAQDSACDAEGEWAALGQALLELTTQLGRGHRLGVRFASPFGLRRGAWAGQSQLLHSTCVRAERARPPVTATRRHRWENGSLVGERLMTSDPRLGATNVGFRRNGLDLKSGGQASHSKMSVAE